MMPRLMSVALTTDAVRERRKTVTRRLGWKFLEPGDRLTLCEKTRGVPKTERVELADVEVVDVRRGRLNEMGYWMPRANGSSEVEREGFPDMSPAEFIGFFCESMKCQPDDVVTRIEWRYLDGDTS